MKVVARRMPVRMVIVSAVVALCAAGCTSSAEKKDGPPASSSSSASTSASASSSPASTAPSSSSAPAPAKTTAAAPGKGTVKQTVAPVPEHVLPPVPITASKKVDDVTLAIPTVKMVTIKATGPGEVAGKALAATVSVKNNAKKAVDLQSAVVTTTQADKTALAGSIASPAKPLPATVAPGATVTGVYVFEAKYGVKNPVTVRITYGAGTDVAVFTGNVS